MGSKSSEMEQGGSASRHAVISCWAEAPAMIHLLYWGRMHSLLNQACTRYLCLNRH